MTIRNAERITGLTITHDGQGFWKAIGTIGDRRVQTHVRAWTPKDAAQKIVDWNWREVSEIVFRRQDYRCARCGLIRPLQNHHKRYRSHGRKDDTEGTEGLCCDCHGKEHNEYAYRHIGPS